MLITEPKLATSMSRDYSVTHMSIQTHNEEKGPQNERQMLSGPNLHLNQVSERYQVKILFFPLLFYQQYLSTAATVRLLGKCEAQLKYGCLNLLRINVI